MRLYAEDWIIIMNEFYSRYVSKCSRIFGPNDDEHSLRWDVEREEAYDDWIVNVNESNRRYVVSNCLRNFGGSNDENNLFIYWMWWG